MTGYIILCLILVRGVVVFLCGIAIRTFKGDTIKLNQQIMIWYAGLRGAMGIFNFYIIAFVLALESINVMPNSPLSTFIFRHVLTVTSFNIIVQSPLTEPLIILMNLVEKKKQEGGNPLQISFVKGDKESGGFLNAMDRIFVKVPKEYQSFLSQR